MFCVCVSTNVLTLPEGENRHKNAIRGTNRLLLYVKNKEQRPFLLCCVFYGGQEADMSIGHRKRMRHRRHRKRSNFTWTLVTPTGSTRRGFGFMLCLTSSYGPQTLHSHDKHRNHQQQRNRRLAQRDHCHRTQHPTPYTLHPTQCLHRRPTLHQKQQQHNDRLKTLWGD